MSIMQGKQIEGKELKCHIGTIDFPISETYFEISENKLILTVYYDDRFDGLIEIGEEFTLSVAGSVPAQGTIASVGIKAPLDGVVSVKITFDTDCTISTAKILSKFKEK